MKRLAAHAIKGGIHYTAAASDNELLFMRTVLAKRLEKRPANAGLQVGAQYATGCAALALGRESDALELITASSEASGAMYAAISARAGTQVSFTFRGAQLSGPSGPPGYNAGPLSWVAATCVALALGRHDVVSVLAAVPVPVLEQAPGERDACWARLAYALQALLAEEDVGPPLTEFARLSQPQHLSIAAPDSVARYASARWHDARHRRQRPGWLRQELAGAAPGSQAGPLPRQGSGRPGRSHRSLGFRHGGAGGGSWPHVERGVRLHAAVAARKALVSRSFEVYSVPPARLQATLGSRSRKLKQEMDLGDDEQSNAALDLIERGATDADGPSAIHGFERLCAHLGKQLPNGNLSPAQYRFMATIDAALEKRGFPILLSTLMLEGAPMPLRRRMTSRASATWTPKGSRRPQHGSRAMSWWTTIRRSTVRCTTSRTGSSMRRRGATC